MLVQKLLAVAQVGGAAVLYVLLLLSVYSIGVILERYVWFKRRPFDAKKMADVVLERLEANDLDGATQKLKESRGVEAEVVADALGWYAQGSESVKEILDKGVRDRRKKTQSGLLFLGTLGNNAPFIGLFGTVLGIVTAFKELSATTAGGGGAGGMNNVMGGIAEALVATAVGILVAIPAVVAYNVFSKKSSDIEENVASLGNAIVAQMKGEANGEAAEGQRPFAEGNGKRAEKAARTSARPEAAPTAKADA